ncbi:MAG: DUF4406 domain-containing protein [Treponema sp.]|jgi:hypothetical protein|nr:DUF4406 domain-containing protein [Treponema sp.]
MIIYISGPITGIRDNNHRGFEKVHSKIIDAFRDTKAWDTLSIITPLAIAADVNARFDQINKNHYRKIKPQWNDYMKACIPALCTATHVLFIKGWEKSKGAALERQIAEAIGILCVESIDDLLNFSEMETHQ